MITLVDGVMGSGKSYYMVRYIVTNVDKYHHIYTNLNEFKYDAFQNVSQFRESEFIDIMQHCKIIYDDDNKTDEDILSYLISVNFLAEDRKPNLIVIDEVHNILNKANDLWTWILTYHRHLYIDFVFATQDYSLIYNKYFKLFQKIYRALPNDRSFKRKSNRYQEHLKLPIVDGKYGTFLRNVYIKKEDKYYDLYKAGDAVRSKSVFTRFIYLFGILLVLAVGGFFWFIQHLLTASDEEKPQVTPVPVSRTFTNVESSTVKDLLYLKLDCRNGQCVNIKNKIEVSIVDLKGLLKDTDTKVLHVDELNQHRALVYLLASPDFLGLFQNRSDKKNEKGFFLTN